MLENKVEKSVLGVYFAALSFLMHYFIHEDINIGVGLTFRHLFALAIIVSGFVVFLVKPRMDRALVSLKSALVFSVPLLVVLVASMLVWLLDKSALSTIFRGISGCIFYTNWLSCAMCAAVLLYVFGEDGIWINLAGLVGANMLMIISIIAEDGLGTYMSELSTLLVTFADETGDVIVKAEIHELAFCLGAYLLYMLFKPKRKLWFWLLFAFGLFCFVSALKRIAIIAIAVAFLIRGIIWLSSRFEHKAACRTANIIMIVGTVILIGYIAVIKADLFSMLQEAGVETSGRNEVYEAVSPYYEFAPSFVGKGIGFLTYQLNEVIHVGVTAVHNDFLQFFIDLGFFGYILWLIAMTYLRTRYFGRHGDYDTATVAAMMIAYLLVCSSTDNTINYPLLTTVLAICIIGNGYEKAVEEEDRILTGKRMKFNENFNG